MLGCFLLSSPRFLLRQNPFHDFSKDVGEAEVAAGVVIGEFLVVDAHEVEDGGVEVVEVDGLVFGVVAVVVG